MAAFHVRVALVAASFAATSFGLGAEVDVKARVEAGEGVPFFGERFTCRDDGVWSDFREVVQYSRVRIFEAAEGPELARLLAEHLAARTANVTEILQCNVGIVAGYHLLARHSAAVGEDWRAYRLLQLALIWVFTLRNALVFPPEAARDWATSTEQIVQEIKLLRGRLRQEQVRRVARLPEVSPSFRQPGLRVAVVSICAYPENHPLVLRVLTPENRRLYAERHGYALHVHMEHPMPGIGVHVQHAKLALVAGYLRSGAYDWVAWLDCDSIIMNLNRTLDSLIHRYARRSVRPHAAGRSPAGVSVAKDAASGGARLRDSGALAVAAAPAAADQEQEVGAASGQPPLSGAAGDEVHGDEPLADEVLEAIVAHIGSCNTDGGCWVAANIRVNRHTHYEVTVSTAQVDMEGSDERLASISIGGRELGECNPRPESDFDCGQFECFRGAAVPHEAVASGIVELRVHSVKTSNDCHCSRIYGSCYSAGLASFAEATNGDKATDPRYGMFVRFTLWPLTGERNHNESSHEATAAACRRDPSSNSSTLPPAAGSTSGRGEAIFTVLKRNAECEGEDVLLGISISLEDCLAMCHRFADCEFVAYGTGRKRGQCFWEFDCDSFEEDSYTVYRLATGADGLAANETAEALVATDEAPAAAAEGLAAAAAAVAAVDEKGASVPSEEAQARHPKAEHSGPAAEAAEPVDEDVDLLITEEGWGLSSANWLIRRSDWSIRFLEEAFELCHEKMPLFGDQDAMIHLLLNRHALRSDAGGDPLDQKVIVIPQRELNAYDALNAHYMSCDAYEEGDLLVTFPGCKEAQVCNPLFRLAADHASGEAAAAVEGDTVAAAVQRSAGLRLFGPPEAAAAAFEAGRKARRQAKH